MRDPGSSIDLSATELLQYSQLISAYANAPAVEQWRETGSKIWLDITCFMFATAEKPKQKRKRATGTEKQQKFYTIVIQKIKEAQNCYFYM